jgi:cyclin G-associated kinase
MAGKASKLNAAFDDILQSQGFVSSQKQSTRSLADLGRVAETRGLEPLQIKVNRLFSLRLFSFLMLKTPIFQIRDWTRGKERNIRALMSSLNEVLWEEAKASWTPPTISDLLNDSQVSFCVTLLKNIAIFRTQEKKNQLK